VASAPVEGEEERAEGRAREASSERRSAQPGVATMTSAVPRTRARSPRTLLAGGAAMLTPEAKASTSGMRTQGQMALMAQRTPGASSTRALRSSRPIRGSTEGPSQGASGGSGRPGTKPLIPMSG
jgi:hypothetical protein